LTLQEFCFFKGCDTLQALLNENPMTLTQSDDIEDEEEERKRIEGQPKVYMESQVTLATLVGRSPLLNIGGFFCYEAWDFYD